MDIFGSALALWSSVWWLVLPILLGSLFFHAWMIYIRAIHLKKLKWIVLRVRTPKEVLRTPKAMEQVFSAAYGSFSHGKRFSETYWDGDTEDYHSFELAATSAGISFYIRTQEKYRHLFEAAIYAQYANAEIDLVTDYVETLPMTVPNKNFELWGGDMILARPNMYPIRTYEYWESNIPEEKIDTMADILEVFSKLKEGEMIWLQILLRPTDGGWIKKEEKERAELAFPEKKKKKPGAKEKTTEFLKNLLLAPFVTELKWAADEEKDDKRTPERLTPGERTVLEAVEEKMGKLAFESLVRWIYIARRDVFSGSIVSSMSSAFRQFNTFNLNSFKFYKPTLVIGRQPFRKRKAFFRKRVLYDRFRRRAFSMEPGTTKEVFSMLNIEELATVYHYPSTIVEAPMLRRVEAKRGSAPPSLPVE